MKFNRTCVVRMTAVLLAMAAVSGLKGTAAYLKSSPDPLQNTFTPGSVQVELQEPSWNPEKGKAVVAGRVIPKDPVLKNTGTVASYVFLEVNVPRRKVRCLREGEDPADCSAAYTDLFSYTAREKWVLLEEETNNQGHVWLYAYEEVLQPGETTKTPLFDKVIYADVLNGELKKDEKMSILLRASAIQADFLDGMENSSGTKESRQKAFELYKNQKKIDWGVRQ